MAWIFLNDSMFSIVENRNDKTGLVVRARIKGDLGKVFDGEEIESADHTNYDYRFRMFLSKTYVAEVMRLEMLGINYDNFKNSVDKRDTERHKKYVQVHGVMASLQHDNYPF